MEREIWKPILSHYGLYKISSHGRIKSLSRNGRPEKILKLTPSAWGYLNVPLHKEGKGWPYFAHKLVAEAFVFNPYNKTMVNHLDGNKKNNHFSNLEWVTHAENCQHALRTGLAQRGEERYNSKLKDSQIMEIYNSSLTIKQLSCIYNVSKTVIGSVKSGKSYNHITGATYVKKIVIDKDKILAIFSSEDNYKLIAKNYGIPERKVHAIKNGEVFRRITHKEYKPRITKYSKELILSILNLNLPHKEIKKLYQVPMSLISAIKTGKCYREITGLSYQPTFRNKEKIAA